jgi:1,4-dihydroxy-2-naphthoate octaprenyltransferase
MVKAWIEAMRLRTLPVSVAGVFAGIGCAAFYSGFRLLPALICLTFAVVAQIVSNFANEYFDYKNGLDKPGRDGFRRGVTEGDISPEKMKYATFSLLFADALLGCSLICFGGWWLVPVGIAIAVFAIAYSAGPYPLSHHGFGDVAVVIFFGIVPVMFTQYVQTGIFSFKDITFPISLAVGLMGANVLIVNNYRDADDDRVVGKITTVVRFGRPCMSVVYLLSGYIAVILSVMPLIGNINPGWIIVPCLYLIVHTALYRKLIQSVGSSLNPLLGKTAMLMFAYSLMLMIALATR